MLTTPRIEIQPVRKSYAEAAEREFLLKSCVVAPCGTSGSCPHSLRQMIKTIFLAVA